MREALEKKREREREREREGRSEREKREKTFFFFFLMREENKQIIFFMPSCYSIQLLLDVYYSKMAKKITFGSTNVGH